MPAKQSWNKDRTVELLTQLEERYGIANEPPRTDPVDELVACILSQHTSDSNSIPAFERLKATFPDWQLAVDAGEERIADVVRNAGLANQKSRSILRCLRQIHDLVGTYSLEHLRSMPMVDARNWLTALPGVGPKTASIVLCFSLGMEAIPVDTHVFRVSWRLGMVEQKAGEGKAHDTLLELVPPDLAFRFHMALIQHGRAVCKAPIPNCEACVVRAMCRWFAEDGPDRRKTELKAKRAKPSAKSNPAARKKRAG